MNQSSNTSSATTTATPPTPPPPATTQPAHPHQLPKDNSPRMADAAPPPYTPPVRLQNIHLQPFMATRGIQLSELQQRLLQQQSVPPTQRPVTTHVLSDTADEAYSEEAAAAAEAGLPFLPLSIRINTSINVSKNNNIVCVTDSPTQHANAIASAVTKAIEESSSGNCGIPMVDGDGNPRPIRIEVDAGTVVDGQGNIVGSEAIILNILRQRDEIRQQREWAERNARRRQREDEDEVGGDAGESSAKRRRSN